jgi:hypothetical protein
VTDECWQYCIGECTCPMQKMTAAIRLFHPHCTPSIFTSAFRFDFSVLSLNQNRSTCLCQAQVPSQITRDDALRRFSAPAVGHFGPWLCSVACPRAAACRDDDGTTDDCIVASPPSGSARGTTIDANVTFGSTSSFPHAACGQRGITDGHVSHGQRKQRVAHGNEQQQ